MFPNLRDMSLPKTQAKVNIENVHITHMLFFNKFSLSLYLCLSVFTSPFPSSLLSLSLWVSLSSYPPSPFI